MYRLAAKFGDFPRRSEPAPSRYRRMISAVLVVVACLLLAADDSAEKKPALDEATASQRPSDAYLVPLNLPIRGGVDAGVKRTIDQLLKEHEGSPDRRPILVVEFRSPRDEAGEGSEFERSLSLARYLASDRLRNVRTVAYVPGTVKGHAVLAVLACEEIIIAEDAELGDAGLDEPYIDDTMRGAYREIAERRHTIPPTIALGMLDETLVVHKAETLDGTQYVFDDELNSLRKAGQVVSVEPVVAAGDRARFTGRELRLEFSFASHIAGDRAKLLEVLDLPPGSLQQDPSLGGDWQPIRVDLSGPIRAKSVNWLIRSAQEQLDAPGTEGANFVCLVVDSAGGSLVDSLRLANFLAALDPGQVRTVAFVEAEARGDAALIAWACDELVISETAIFGGPGSSTLSDRQRRELRETVKGIAHEKQQSWSLAVALVDPDFAVYRYSDGSETRYLSEEEWNELEDPGRWMRGPRIETDRGLSGAEARDAGLARHTAGSFSQFQQLYQLDDELQSIEPNWAHLAIERLSSPQIAGALLFIAWFALIIEMSQPGIGIAGFASAVCFLLFFWANILHGTAVWLEVLLFGAGVASLVVEIFVLPGFGVFGFGGALLVITSLVLASQTFVIPRNSYQLSEFANSMIMVTVGLVGAFASLLIVRRYLPEAPVFKRMMLSPPDDDDREERESRELLADYRHLLGKSGKTTTRLNPAGKARFGDDVINVISDGDALPIGCDVVVSDVLGSRVLVQPSGVMEA